MGDKRRAQQAAPLQIQIGRWGVGKVARFLEFLARETKTGRPDKKHRDAEVAQPFEAQGKQAAPLRSQIRASEQNGTNYFSETKFRGCVSKWHAVRFARSGVVGTWGDPWEAMATKALFWNRKGP
jgi:hypothetical protein